MTTTRDTLGGLLREFYGTFGVPEEGPPHGYDVTAMIGGNVAESELSILRAALSDEVARRQFRTCRDIIEDLATRLTGEELLRELCGIPVPENGFEQLSSGVFWFALASSLDSRRGNLPVTPVDEMVRLAPSQDSNDDLWLPRPSFVHRARIHARRSSQRSRPRKFQSRGPMFCLG